MAVLPILTYPHPVLRQKAQAVQEITPEIQELIRDLFETMRFDDQGIGLAANQVGVLKRVVVMDLSSEDPNMPPLALINPEIIGTSEITHTQEEACLSLPHQAAPVTRPHQVTVSYLDDQGAPRQLQASDLLARCLQHEIDHLNGILYPERISVLKRKILYAKALKTGKKALRGS